MALETGFKIIGTAGDTVDGRVIQESWLKQAAKNYSPEKYTAVINLNHWNPKFYGTYGKVLAVKLTKNNEGKTCLSANIEPNQKLINIGKVEVLFTSMEIDPNFQKSGEAYLVGLAVTPKPASVGTEQISFSSEPLGPIQTTDFYQFDFSDLNDEQNDPDEAKFSKWLKNFFFNQEATETEEPPMSGADNKKLEELTTQLSSLAAQVQKLTGDSDNPEQKPDKSTNVKADKLVEKLSGVLGEFGVTLSVEQPKSDSERIDELAKQVETLTTKFGNGVKPEDKGNPSEDNAQLVALQEQVTKISETLNLAINGEKPSTNDDDQPNNKDDSFV